MKKILLSYLVIAIILSLTGLIMAYEKCSEGGGCVVILAFTIAIGIGLGLGGFLVHWGVSQDQASINKNRTHELSLILIGILSLVPPLCLVAFWIVIFL